MKELKKLGKELLYIETEDNNFFIFSPKDGSWIITSELVDEEIAKKYLPNRIAEKYVDVRDIVLNTTDSCNLGCVYCYVGGHTNRDLSYETGKKWLKESNLFEQVRFLFAHPDKYGKGIEHLPPIETLSRKYIPIFVNELEEFSRTGKYFLNNIETRIITFALPRVLPICGRCANSFIQPAIYVDIDGTIKECDSILHSKLEKYNILSNVKDLKQILNTPKNFRTTLSILPKNCRVCPLLFFCGGGCPSEVVNGTNYYCSIYKREYIEVMRRMSRFIKFV